VAWDRWGDVIERWLGPATEVMLDLAEVTEGSRVLDVAAGAGGQSLAAARRAGPTGHVLATDISSNLLDLAARRARDAGPLRAPRRRGHGVGAPDREHPGTVRRIAALDVRLLRLRTYVRP
jgi:cyclopropane fatty-acyl-phospholipid synthase-like methyltransferase